MIELINVNKKFNRDYALKDINLQIASGEVVGLLGPNGAGKTTMMRLITGYLVPTKGKITVDGFSVEDDSTKVRSLLGYLPENNPLYDDLLVGEYLEFVARSFKLTSRNLSEAINNVTLSCGLEGKLHQQIRLLSKGFRQRVGIAGTLVHDPQVLILDEPTSGLDPNQVVEIRSLLRQLGEKKTVILSTHILPEVSAICERCLIIHRGEMVFDGRLADLTKSKSGGVNHLIIRNVAVAEATEALKGLLMVTSVQHKKVDDDCHFVISSEQDCREAILGLVMKKKWQLLELYQEEQHLEDVFRELTTNE